MIKEIEMREIEFRCWNDIDKMMIEWGTLRASPIFLMNVIKGIVKHHTLEQYTGLKDCNGVKIFEGDIISEPVSPVGGVDGGYLYKQREIKWLGAGQGYALHAPGAASKVIGNIHEKT